MKANYTFEEIPGGYEITKYLGNELDIIIPSVFNGRKVISIGIEAFAEVPIQSVYIPNGIIKIKDNAFSNCLCLKDICLPESLDEIGEEAFYNCSTLEEISIPSKVTEISDSLFSDCYSLKKVKLSNKIISIGSEAFSNCISLTEVVLPEACLSIGDSAFEECYSLTNVIFNRSLTTISSAAFMSCKSLSKVDLSLTNVNDIGSTAFNECNSLASIKFSSKLTSLPEYLISDSYLLRYLEIPSGVKEVSSELTENCIQLESVFIPKTVISVESEAFISSPNLVIAYEGLSIPNSWDEEWNIKNYPVNYGVKPGSIKLGNSLFKDYIFSINDDGVVINKYLGDEANVVIPDKYRFIPITKIGDAAFIGKKGIKKVVLNSTITSIGDYAFMNCSNLEEINLEASSVESIGMYAFMGCERITEIEYPNSLTFLGGGAFFNCKSLLFTRNSNIESLDGYTFMNCSNLSTIYIPKDVSSIGKCAFQNCYKLKSVNAEQSLDSIGDYAFSNCYSLCNFTALRDLTYIGSGAFSCCYSLRKYLMGNKVEEIGNYPFYHCYSLEQITLSDILQEIPSHLFDHCYNLKYIQLPMKTIKVNTKAFNDCSKLERIYVVSDIVKVEDNITTNSPNAKYYLEDYQVPVSFDKNWNEEGNPCLFSAQQYKLSIDNYVDKKAEFIYGSCKDGYKLVKYVGECRDVVIPEMFNSRPIISIGCGAFINSRIYSITLNSSIKTIEAYAFSEAFSLSVVDFNNSKIKRIGNNAFDGCNSLRKLVIPSSCEYIGYYAFNHCGLLKLDLSLADTSKFDPLFNPQDLKAPKIEVKEEAIPEEKPGVERVGNWGYTAGSNRKEICAYYGEEADIVIPNGVTSIAEEAFYCAVYLHSVKLPETLKTIKKAAFLNCSFLERINLPFGITTLEENVFQFNQSLYNLVIPASVTKICKEALSFTLNSNPLFIPKTVTTIEAGAIYSTSDSFVVNFEASSKLPGYSDDWNQTPSQLWMFGKESSNNKANWGVKKEN